MENRAFQIRRVLIGILFLNWAVALAKLAYGWINNLSSMTADGFHSFSDGTSNIIALIGVAIASAPADKDHHYGHKKYETMFSLGIVVMLFLLCFYIVSESIQRILNPVPMEVSAAGFIVMIITIIVNVLVVVFERREGNRLKSDILMADSLHTTVDILASVSVIFAFIFIRLGFPIFDPLIAIGIACAIAYAGFAIVQKSSKVLCDTAAPVDTTRIEAIVLGINGVKTCHKIRTRGREDDVFIDLHVQVDPNMRVEVAHKIAGDIEFAIKEKIPGATDVMVHIEPIHKR
jgi:cation diffusion facilitator family transporter